MDKIPEKDWKLLRSMKDEKLTLLCDRVMAKLEEISAHRKGREHQAFLETFEEINRGNEIIADLFDDIRRSNANLKLRLWKRHGLLSDEEVALFSETTRQALDRC